MDISEYYKKCYQQKNNSRQVNMFKSSPNKELVNIYTELDILARDQQILLLQKELVESKKSCKGWRIGFERFFDKLRTGELIYNPDYDDSYENYQNYLKFYKSI